MKGQDRTGIGIGTGIGIRIGIGLIKIALDDMIVKMI